MSEDISRSTSPIMGTDWLLSRSAADIHNLPHEHLHSQPAAEASTQGHLERVRAKYSSPDRPTKKRQLSWGTLKGNKNAKKTLRRVEIGWIHFSENENVFKQVRTKRGGGTRHVCADSFATIGDLQKDADIFFSKWFLQVS